MSARSQSVLVRGCTAACAVSGSEGRSTASIDPAQTLALSSQTNLASSQSDRVKGWYAYAPLAKLFNLNLIPCRLSARMFWSRIQPTDAGLPGFQVRTGLYQRTDGRGGSF